MCGRIPVHQTERGTKMTNEEISNLITPEFISTLETVLNHLYKCPNTLGLDFNDIDFLPGVMKGLVSGEYYD
jgi:hypothetical protein